MIKHFKHTPNAEVCKKLGISLATMHRIKRELGLKKSRQFMKKWSEIGVKRAREVNRANNWPPKGYIIPNTNRFKKGESNRDRLSRRRYKACLEKRRASWRKTYDDDKRRWKWDLPQKTKFRFSAQTVSKRSFRYNMKKHGYIVDRDKNIFYYPNEEMRRPIAERNGAKHGITFLPLPTACAQ